MFERRVYGRIVERVRMPCHKKEAMTIGYGKNIVPQAIDVVFLVNTETRLEMWHGGALLRGGPEYSDGYGFLTSLSFGDLHHMLAAKYAVNEQSTLELRLITSVYLEPFTEGAEVKEWNKTAFERNVRYRLTPLSHEVLYARTFVGDDEVYFQSFSRTRISDEVTWSSKNSIAENDAIKALWVDKWSDVEFGRMHARRWIDGGASIKHCA